MREKACSGIAHWFIKKLHSQKKKQKIGRINNSWKLSTSDNIEKQEGVAMQVDACLFIKTTWLEDIQLWHAVAKDY